MSISTYSELQTAVANWLDRSDLTSRIPEFIAIAESTLANSPNPVDPDVLPGVRIRDMVTRVTTSASSQYTDLPTDLLEIENVQLNLTNGKKSLDFLTPEQIDERKMGSTTGQPTSYTIIGGQIQLAPSPDATYTLEIAYYQKYTAFSADADTNNLLSNHPQTYLYASLIAAAPFLGDEARIQSWATIYKGAVYGINATDQRGSVPKTALRSRGIWNP